MMSHRLHHGHLAPLHTEAAFDTFGTLCLCVLALLLVLAMAGCMDYSKAAGGPPMTSNDWLDRRDLAAVAHCPPPPLVGEYDACSHLAWDFHR